MRLGRDPCCSALPQGEPFGSPVGRRLSKDVRAAPDYKNWLRSLLRVDHRIVFSHADFHPRNIMVIDGPDGVIELSGILD